jgi:hypothetical protein
MTGQVKEEVITRMGELGLSVEAGQLAFEPLLLKRREFLRQPADWKYVDVAGRWQSLPLAAGNLAFTVCQVPVVYELAEDGPAVVVALVEGELETAVGLRLSARTSAAVFERTGEVKLIRAAIPASMLRLA